MGDKDENGKITYKEFLDSYVRQQLQKKRETDKKTDKLSSPSTVMDENKASENQTLKQCWDYFRTIDLNNDGMLDSEEFHAMLTNIGIDLDVDELKKAWNRLDKDENGKITYKEFLDSYANEKLQKNNTSRSKRNPPQYPRVRIQNDSPSIIPSVP